MVAAGGRIKATDTKLGREVAHQAAAQKFANDSSCMARLAREARALASLNDPHTAETYGVEDRALVMELMEGEALSGPPPSETALCPQSR
jgi:serine/threonine protein kinase